MAGRKGVSRQKIFLTDLENQFSRAKDELEKLGYAPDSWNEVLKGLELQSGVYGVVFHSLDPFIKDVAEAESAIKNLNALNWAEIIAITKYAATCKDPAQSFALGFALRDKLAYLGQSAIIKRSFKKRVEKGGRARKGKVKPITQLIADLVSVKSDLKPRELINWLNKGDDFIETKLTKAKAYTDIEIVQVDKSREEVNYSIKGDHFVISFARIANVISELKKKSSKKVSRVAQKP